MLYIVLDAGHGGYDTGAEYQGRFEKDDTLSVALEVGELLSRNGIKTAYTRNHDVYHSPLVRAQMANTTGADLFISFHREKGDSPNALHGIRILMNEESSLMLDIGRVVGEQLEEAGYGHADIVMHSDQTELQQTQMPALAIDLGYIDSDKDNALLDQSFNETVYAIANAIYYVLYGNEITKNTLEDMLYPSEVNVFI